MTRVCHLLIGVGLLGWLCGGIQAQVAPQAATTQYGLSLMGAGRWLEAEQVWQTVCARPDCKGMPRLEAMLSLAQAQAHLHQYEQARATLDKVLTQMVLDQPSMLMYGTPRALVERTFLDALDPDPAYLDATIELALDDLTRGQGIIGEYLNRLMRDTTSGNQTIGVMVRGTSAMSKIADALGRYRQAYPGHPLYDSIGLAQAKLLLVSENRQGARAILEEGLVSAAGTPNEEPQALLLVEALTLEKDIATTTKTIAILADQYQTNSTIQNQAMAYLKKVGAVYEALAIALRLVQTEKSTQGEAIKTLYWAGELAIAQGNTPLARTCFEAFVKAAPELPTARKAREYLKALPNAE